MTTPTRHGRAERAYWRITSRPRIATVVAALVVAAGGAFLPLVSKDPGVEAFIPPGDPTLAMQAEVRDRFGMGDPLVLLVIRDAPDGIFTPHALALVDSLTRAAQDLPGVDPDGVSSLTTVKVVEGTSGSLAVTPVVDGDLSSPATAERAHRLVDSHAALRGTLASKDGQSTLVVMERFEWSEATRIYRDLLALTEAADKSGGEQILVSGHGAVSSTLGEYIDSDTRVLYVAVTLIIALVLTAAFRTLWGVLLPLALVGATLAICIGSMGLTGAPFTVITAALPVVLSALVVCDAIHILSLYYERLAAEPGIEVRRNVVDAMVAIWRPILSARVTDIAGFAGLYLGSSMPPLKIFGLYGSIGIGAEMALALLVYPCLLVLVRPGPSPAFGAAGQGRSVLVVRAWLESIAMQVLSRSRVVLFVSALVLVAGISGAARIVVNDSWVGNFDEAAMVRRGADEMIRRHGITTDMDLIVDSGQAEGMLEPAMLGHLARLREELAASPHVTHVRSIADELMEINQATHDGRAEEFRLPVEPGLAAQYLLIADPTETGRWLDAEQRRALVRVHTDTQDYKGDKLLTEHVRGWLAQEFPKGFPTVEVGGMVGIGYAWVSGVASFHVLSTMLSIGFCWLQMMAGFASWSLGTLAVIPMLAAMLLMYAVMGWGGIPLGIGTSMFAALAIGTGVDFAIHTVDRFVLLHEQEDASLERMLREILPTTGRAILYSAAALVLGFSALGLSKVPAVRSLGMLVTVSVLASLMATLTLLPVLIKILRPKAIVRRAT